MPWKAAKVCFQNQIHFNYLETRHLWEDAKITPEGIHFAGMLFKALIVETEPPAPAIPILEKLQKYGWFIQWDNNNREDELIRSPESLVQKDILIKPKNKNIRVRRVVKYRFPF